MMGSDTINVDSIWNGADDNASVCVALLAIGRAFVKQPAKRSALFVWHGSEERGLQKFNGDMIGRKQF